MTSTRCTTCRSTDLVTAISFGPQPPSNRYVPSAAATAPEERYPLSLGRCGECDTIQLVDRMPVDAIRPRYDWISYNEPEGHLDEVARTIGGLPGIGSASRLLGATYKDRSTLDRLVKLGIDNARCLAPADLGAAHPSGLETVQQILSNEANVRRLRTQVGMADVVIARHLVEHAPDAARLIGSLRGVLAPGGYLVLEVPDSERFLRLGNHAFVWEEHFSYFTEASLRRLAREVSAEVAWLGRFPYPYEDSLNVALRFELGAAEEREAEVGKCGSSATLLEDFAASLDAARHAWREHLRSHARATKVAVFGAGHLAAKFVNFLDIDDLIDCVIDDHPRKAGLLMPGSHLPIVHSSELGPRGIGACISTLNPESEAKVRVKLRDFFDRGGVFERAFATA